MSQSHGSVTSQLFTGNPKVRDRLNRALNQDADHILPKSAGDHVGVIQTALLLVSKATIADDELKNQFYGSQTAAAVAAFKSQCSPPLLNFQNKIDDIVGRKTTFELDRQMKEFEKNNPPVNPIPLSGASADVQIGPLGPRANIVTSYYQNCGLETIGPARVATAGLSRYTTFEGLIDLLLTRSSLQQVIVNHGNPDKGLIVPWCAESRETDTQANIKFFSKIADALELKTANKANTDFQDSLTILKFILNVSEAVILRIAAKIVKLRQKRLVLHLRACNIPAQVALRYKEAFRSPLLTFHSVRLFFLHIKPVKFAAGHSAADFPFSNNTGRDRARVFVDFLGELTNLVVAVRDLDGHTQIEDFSFVDEVKNDDIQEWAKVIIGKWDGAVGQFVLPILWDNNERSFSCPVEDSWRLKLGFV